MTGLLQTSSEETRPWPSFPLIGIRDSFSPWTWARSQTGGALPTLADLSLHIFWYIIFIALHFCAIILWHPRFGWMLVAGLHKEVYLQFFKCVSFSLHSFCGLWEGWDHVNRFNHTSWMVAVTPTDRPKSARNRCVIEVFDDVLVLSHCLLSKCEWQQYRST